MVADVGVDGDDDDDDDDGFFEAVDEDAVVVVAVVLVVDVGDGISATVFPFILGGMD